MAKNRYDPKPLGELMGKWSNKINSFSEKTNAMKELQSELESAIGPILSKKCRIANYREGTLIIEAASATLATRLNFLKSDMLSHFRKAGFIECAQIKITTNPEAQQRLAEPSRKQVNTHSSSGRNMSEHTAQQLNELADHAPPSLQAKLRKLASHASKSRQKK